MIELLKSVEVGVPGENKVKWLKGVIVGRTVEKDPNYDVMLEVKSVKVNVPENMIRQAA